MVFKGTLVTFDYQHRSQYTGKPAQFTHADCLIYDIDKQWLQGNDTVANFRVLSVSEQNDTTVVMRSSPLIVNAEGMYFWVSDSMKSDLVEKFGKKEAKKMLDKTQWTIKLPIYMGETWKSYDYTNESAEYTCISNDTLIQTGMGPVHAFEIRVKRVTQRGKDFYVVNETTDYYAQNVGKVYTVSQAYTVLTKTGEIRPLYSDTLLLDKTWWDADVSEK